MKYKQIVNISKGEQTSVEGEKAHFLTNVELSGRPPSTVLLVWIFSSCVESNLFDRQHCKMDYVTVGSARIVPSFFFAL